MNLIIVSHNQFGYHIDAFNYAKILSKYYKIYFICYDFGKQKIYLDNVEIVYVQKSNVRLNSLFRFLKTILKLAPKNDIIFIQYFKFCSLLRIRLDAKKTILDFRTASISQSSLKRKFEDIFAKFESYFYKNVSSISSGVINRLKLDADKTQIIPLGANKTHVDLKDWNEFTLLYVGTLNNRFIEKTIGGLEFFYLNHKINFKYFIIGDGIPRYKNPLIHKLNSSPIKDKIYYLGPLFHEELAPYFLKCNVGISFIPLKDYYDFQPPTKTFEYIMAGLFCIATRTSANSEIINSVNGILIEDTEFDFADKLYKAYLNRHTYNSIKIADTLESKTWENIITYTVKPYLESIYRNNIV